MEDHRANVKHTGPGTSPRFANLAVVNVESDPGRPIAYEALSPGTPVFDTGGAEVGKVKKVLADEQEDVFDGIVIETADGTRFIDAPQIGAINTTYSGWRGSILTALNELLCWDQLYAIGGALRHIEFRPALGAFTCAMHPASVSTAPVQAMEISLYPAYVRGESRDLEMAGPLASHYPAPALEARLKSPLGSSRAA